MRWVRVLLLLSIVTTGCTRDGDERAADTDDLLTPLFAPATTATTTQSQGSAAGGPGATSTAPNGASATTVAGSPPPAAAGVSTAALTDRIGDLTPSPLDPPPSWADLAGATLNRRPDGFELRVRLGGPAAPTTTDEDHTMNVASFYDLDGNGRVDFEVWANLAAGGWGASYFDNTTKGKNRYGDASGVAIAVEGTEVVLRFPLASLRSAASFRWAVASEWGRYEVLGTAAMARDDVPDFDGAAPFPG
jgi:hypothetical protein